CLLGESVAWSDLLQYAAAVWPSTRADPDPARPPDPQHVPPADTRPDPLAGSGRGHYGRGTRRVAPRGTRIMRQHSASHTFNRRTFLQAAVLGLTGGRLSAGSPEGEVLPNGIRLPSPWPPRRAYSLEPMPVPYLDRPPAVIPIDCGRQLFVD